MVTVKKATSNDLNEVMRVIEQARAIMRANGNLTQWINGYPASELILNDIENENGYVILNNNVIEGYFALIIGTDPEPTYKAIESGNWLNKEPYGVIHRLASTGKIKGIAKACFDYAFTLINNIKVDTHSNNLPMKHFFQKYGFTYCGTIYVADGSPRDAFQMVVID